MTLTPRRVLILEDETIIAFDVEAILVEAGFEVLECLTSGEDALRWLDSHRPDVVICDVHLRDGSCVQVVRKLAEMDIPYVVFSAGAPGEEDDPVFARALWLEKPARPDQVITAVREALTSS